MVEPFIRNHQYNLIRKQAGILQQATRTVSDPKVLEAVRYSAESKVLEGFSEVTETQREILEKFSELKAAEDFQHYLSSLVPFLVEFPKVTEKEIKKLFAKNKKLTLPDLATLNYRHFTYIGWTDISTTKWFLVYHLRGQVVGVEGKYTLTNKKDICSLCNSFGEVALVSAMSKSRPANTSPDYYKSVGNYMCINSHACNKNITDTTSLERFIQSVIQ
ncbi:FusB/FusC family EF-G-binding protein [Ammoniphilus sp. 3BR4]|uniref:FusB/FusC family EF-G-binding protein n=1 Tax=Ammoniphilus sp. 3BR4 TaxID=3158265 RepID=UPI003464F98D